MSGKNPEADGYFENGCGRCELYATDRCKARRWKTELARLREIILDCGLDEEVKWSIPCYTADGKNILLLSAFKNYCAVSFFKGALLKDPAGILVTQTANSQAARQIRFTGLEQIDKMRATLAAYVKEAVELEKAGMRIEYKKTAEYSIPPEFQEAMDADDVLREAFHSLTPGRQRGYLLHFSAPKQSKTRISRIEKCVPRIRSGLGLNDR